MTTAKEREAAFRKDLAELLKKHNAELYITDDGASRGMQQGVVEVNMEGKYDGDGNTLVEYADFRL